VGFFKPSASTTSNKAAARLHALIWVLIYGGLLTLVLGLSVAPIDDDTAWSLIAGGGIVAAVGVALIVVRSKMKVDS
jgi:formate hydrogenlyase subunit 3/multisubunit Na+/H+ antiporter MnhD subunit